MPDFIYDDVALDGQKIDLEDLSAGDNPENFIVDEDWNGAIQALYDAKNAIISNTFFGLARQGGRPAIPDTGSSNFIWLSSSGQIFLCLAGANDLLIPTAYALRTADAAIDANALVSLSAANAGRVLMTPVGSDPGQVTGIAVAAASSAGSSIVVCELHGLRFNVLSDGTGAISPGLGVEVSNTLAGRVQPPTGGKTFRYVSQGALATLNALVEVQW